MEKHSEETGQDGASRQGGRPEGGQGETSVDSLRAQKNAPFYEKKTCVGSRRNTGASTAASRAR